MGGEAEAEVGREVNDQFPTAQSAKEFLVSKVWEEAQKENVSLSGAERKMMYYSVEERTVADAVMGQFDDDDVSDAFEEKVSSLLTRAYEGSGDKGSFENAFQTLAQGDHYLGVMAPPGCKSAAGLAGWLNKLGNSRLLRFLAPSSQHIQDRSGRDVLLLFVTAFAPIGAMLLFDVYWQPAKEAFWRWLGSR